MGQDQAATTRAPFQRMAAGQSLFRPAGKDWEKDWAIRPYRPSDRPAIRRICCDNGYLGQPIDAIFCDRELYAAIFLDPYLDHAPDWVFVAEHRNAIVGYLTGAVTRRFQHQQILDCCRASLRLMVRNAVRTYGDHLPSRSFTRWLLTRACFERPRRPPIAAHMHFNVASGFRGRFLAQRLWRGFERKLHEAGIYQYYGEVLTSNPQLIQQVYGRYGLSLFDLRRTSIFEPEFPDPVWIVCLVKSMSENLEDLSAPEPER